MYDEETGVYYLNARYYDPKIARFLTEDSYRGSIADPLSLNLYTYCHNEPMMYWDPTGHIYTNWDKEHGVDKEKVDKATKDWETANKKGDKAGMAAAHAAAEKERQKKRSADEVGSSQGYTMKANKDSKTGGNKYTFADERDRKNHDANRSKNGSTKAEVSNNKKNTNVFTPEKKSVTQSSTGNSGMEPKNSVGNNMGNVYGNNPAVSTGSNPFTSGITSEGSISDVNQPYIIVGGWNYGDPGSQTNGLGASLGSASWELTHTQADYKYGGAGLGAIKGEACATVDIKEGLNASAIGSLVNGEVYLKIPIPFTEKSLKAGIEGHLFGAGFELKAIYGSKKQIKLGAAAIVGGTITLEIDKR